MPNNEKLTPYNLFRPFNCDEEVLEELRRTQRQLDKVESAYGLAMCGISRLTDESARIIAQSILDLKKHSTAKSKDKDDTNCDMQTTAKNLEEGLERIIELRQTIAEDCMDKLYG